MTPREAASAIPVPAGRSPSPTDRATFCSKGLSIQPRLWEQVCQRGYVIVFEECNWGFNKTAIQAMEGSGCRVRFI
ncbi:MAG: hypothetical protein ACRDM1_02165, partial [Gaiellaceae bacterium]